MSEDGCDVCGATPAVVASSAFGPVSFAFCPDCLSSGAEPYAFLVARVAEVGGRHRAPAVSETLRATLRTVNRSIEQFDHDVAQACVLLATSRQEMDPEGGPRPGTVVVAAIGTVCHIGRVKGVSPNGAMTLVDEAGKETVVDDRFQWFVPRTPNAQDSGDPGLLPQYLPTETLLSLNAQVIDILRERDVLRTNNNPAGGYAEFLVEQKLGLRRAPNSATGYDALSPEGRRYQIKARRLSGHRPSRQLGAIRDLEKGLFDDLIAILFDASYRVIEAYLLPHSVVVAYAEFRQRTNSYRLHAQGAVLTAPGVKDITDRFR